MSAMVAAPNPSLNTNHANYQWRYLHGYKWIDFTTK